MSRTKEITEDLVKRVDVAHQARKVTEPSLRVWTLQINSQKDCVQMKEIQVHCYLPEKWSTNKDHSKAEPVIVCEVGNF